MPRNRPAVRMLKMILTLERARYGRTLHELATEYGVCERTIRRDFEALAEAGVPIVDVLDEERTDFRTPSRWRVLNWREVA